MLIVYSNGSDVLQIGSVRWCCEYLTTMSSWLENRVAAHRAHRRSKKSLQVSNRSIKAWNMTGGCAILSQTTCTGK